MGHKIEVQETVNRLNILIFAKPFLRPRQSGAHGTCHACHTLDTPLQQTSISKTVLPNPASWDLGLLDAHQ